MIALRKYGMENRQRKQNLNKKNIEYTKQLKKVHIFYSEFRILNSRNKTIF